MGNNLRKKIFFLCLPILIGGYSHAQKVRLNGYASYVLDGSYHIYYENDNFYEGKINHGLQLGVGMEYLITPNYSIELSYLNRNTNVFQEEAANSVREINALQFHYVLLGMNAYSKNGAKKLQVFGGVSAGIIVQAVLSPNNVPDIPVDHALVKFAWATKVGAFYLVSPRVGIKLQAQWLSALQFANGDVNFDVGRSDSKLAEYSIANQFELGSALVITLGSAKDKKLISREIFF